MGRKSVAVLDVRSSEITVFVGERGVNNTFVFKANRSEPYDGYEDGKFYNVKGLAEAVFKALTSVEHMCGERIKELFVGVPGEFCAVVPKEQNVGFSKKRKITQKDVETLYASGAGDLNGYRLIRATSMIYVTADNRRVVDPIGLPSTSLSGVLSYFYCSDYFADVMHAMFKTTRIALRFLPTEAAMASYLIPPETRDEYALFLDVGYLSSSILVLLGGGVKAQKSYWTGRAQIVVLIMERLNVPYDVAGALLARANLFARGGEGKVEFNYRGNPYEIDTDLLIETVKEGLDGLCEPISEFLEGCSGREFDYRPLYVTGEGITDIRGALEYVSKRINRICEEVAPDLPYYNKPAMSSRIALMDMAQDDRQKGGIINRLLNAFGG